MLVHVVEGGGHIAVDDGFGPWPLAERWALSGRPADVWVATTKA
jgi:predicted alpha/beta hydrolase family esterase